MVAGKPTLALVNAKDACKVLDWEGTDRTEKLIDVWPRGILP